MRIPAFVTLALHTLLSCGAGASNAILTRNPVLDRAGHRLRPRSDWRTLAHVRLDIRGSVVDIYGTHLHHTAQGGDLRVRQVRDLLAIIEAQVEGPPSILMGDFNALVLSCNAESTNILAERGRFEILEARRVLDRPDASGVWPSDHFGVYARLRVVRPE